MIRLGDIAVVTAGYPFRGAIGEHADGDALAVQMRDLRGDAGRVDWSGVARTRLTGKRKPDWLRFGDILLSSIGDNNAAILVGDVPAPAVCTPNIFLIRAHDETAVLPGYLAWALNQQMVREHWRSSALGTNVQRLRRADVENASLPLPPVEQQARIAALAQTAREERAALEALIPNRERELAGLAQNLFNWKSIHKVVS